jgi:acyl transferase domain-containing protein
MSSIPPEHPAQVRHQPIAVIGMGCRFAGADGPDQLWELLCGGIDATRETPIDRYDIDALYSPAPRPGTVRSRRAGYLSAPYRFDAEFFGVSDEDAAKLDPQQRLLLTTAWEALEDAGIPPSTLRSTRTGVYVGASYVDFVDRVARHSPGGLDLTMIYNFRSMLAGRLSYWLDLRGPSICVDTACSSSLVAVHLACQSLRLGESTMALAAGVSLKLIPDRDIVFSQARVVAPDGRSKFGDADADGAGFSDGIGIVVLKPLDAALADGDRVRAVILGSAVTHDGATGGALLTPSVQGHVEMLRWAYRDAGVDPATVDFIEAHGNGTPTMDPIEFAALDTVLSTNRPAERPCFVGSVKTNIGHAESAAGVAGLIKAVLCLQHGRVVPSLNFTNPNPDIAWDRVCLTIPTAVRLLPDRGRPLLAGVSGQGLSSVNAHLVVGQSRVELPVRPPARQGRPHLLVLSARTPAALTELAAAYTRYLRPGGAGHHFELRDICHSAATRREHHPHRLAVAGAKHGLLADLLAAAATVGEIAAPNHTSESFDEESALHRHADRYLRGSMPCWAEILEPGGRYVPLPAYPWQGSEYPIDAVDFEAQRAGLQPERT